MKCQRCGSPRLVVLRTMPHKVTDTTRRVRRRMCVNCGAGYLTTEKILREVELRVPPSTTATQAAN